MIELPDIFPTDIVRVSDEKHKYKVFDGDAGPLPKEEYVLDKAPVEVIETVVGKYSGTETEFVKGVDYELSADSERLIWLNGDRPDAGTNFAVTYRSASILGRYIGAANEEFDSVENDI